MGESAPLKVLVGEADLKRVRAAELVILDEEGREGRFARNHDGQLVPAMQVEEEEHRKRLELDRGRPFDEPARPRDTWRPTRAPPASAIKMFPVETRSKKAKDGGLEGRSLMIPKKHQLQKSEQDEENARSGAMRASGALGPLQSASTMWFRGERLLRRSRGAALDADIGRLKRVPRVWREKEGRPRRDEG